MEELLGMGFSEDLAAQALAATGGSPLAAADWILSRSSSSIVAGPSSPPPALPLSQPTSIQPCLERFFASSSNPKTGNPVSSVKLPPAPSSSSLPGKRRHPSSATPLSDRMRPATLDAVLGQDHLLGSTSVLRSSRIPSIVLWGPPGSGKTTIARALSSALPASLYAFVTLFAVSSGVRELREAIDGARRARSQGRRTVLFVDEIHRFSKSQQDSFLPAIEDGSIILVGATTENPSFQLTTPLLSRCRVLALQPLKPQHIEGLLRRAISDAERGLQSTTQCSVSAAQEAIDFLSLHCDGDARVALDALEIAATIAAGRNVDGSNGQLKVSLDHVKEAMQCKHLAYDRAGEEHYNLISALHKSIRGSDADAAIYWLARMLEGGEEPLYIARRLVRLASEDIGLADPAALPQAVSCYQACHFIGMPECDVCLAQCVSYLALAPKSVAIYRAYKEAKRVIRESTGGNEGVPLHLRNAPTKLMKDMGYGKDYMYPPDHRDCSSQTYLPLSLLGHKFLDWPSNDEKQE